MEISAAAAVAADHINSMSLCLVVSEEKMFTRTPQSDDIMSAD